MATVDTKHFRSDHANAVPDWDLLAPLDEAGEWEYTTLLDASQHLDDGTAICAQGTQAGLRAACRRLGWVPLTPADLELLHSLAARGLCIEIPAYTGTPTAETSLAMRKASDTANRKALAKAGHRPGVRWCNFGKGWVELDGTESVPDDKPGERATLMGWWVPNLAAYGITARKGAGFIQPRPTPGKGAHGLDDQADDGTNWWCKRRRVPRVGRMGEGVASAGAAIAAGAAELAAMLMRGGGYPLPPPSPRNAGGHVLPPTPKPAPAPTAPQEKTMLDTIPMKKARNYRVANRPDSAVELIVLHSMEAAEKPSTAENVAAWFAGPGAPGTSAHYCVDADSIVQCVPLADIAHAAPGSNHNGVQIEMAGYAKQSAAEWDDEYSRAMLGRVASLMGALSARFGIPLEYVDEAGLRAGKRGVTTHFDVSKAFKKSSHRDPGPGFPMARVLGLAMAARAAL